MKISVCGKGGSGKSVVTCLLAKQARSRGYRVLVVDSDESNSGLFKMLGFTVAPVPLMAIAGGKSRIRGKMTEGGILTENQIGIGDIPSQYLVEKNGIMLACIGKILQAYEGCACPMGVLSREFLKKLQLADNEIAIVDMEAGIEHFGRGIDEGIDRIILVVEPSAESIAVSRKIREIAAGMSKAAAVVLNKTDSDRVVAVLEKKIDIKSVDVIGSIPNDPEVFEACLEGRALEDSEAFAAAGNAMDYLLDFQADGTHTRQ